MYIHNKIYSRFKKEIFKKSYPRLINGEIPLNGSSEREICLTTDDVISKHFSLYADNNHPCKKTLAKALKRLGNKKANII